MGKWYESGKVEVFQISYHASTSVGYWTVQIRFEDAVFARQPCRLISN